LRSLQIAVQEAETAFRDGRFPAALERYRQILSQRLEGPSAVSAPGAADMVVIERLADLSLLFGAQDAADDLIGAVVLLGAGAGNFVAADYASLKRADIALARGRARDALEHITGMEPRTGDLGTIELSAAGLRVWEDTVPWRSAPAADRTVMLSRLCLVLGRLLAFNGQYREAIAVLLHGLQHAVDGKPALATRGRIPTTIALASAQLEMGGLGDAEGTLAMIEREIDPVAVPGYWVEWTEVSGRLSMLTGRLGAALDGYEKVSTFCRERGFSLALVTAEINLAQIQILLNQTGAASARLHEAREAAGRLGDPAAAVRADALISLAWARARSLVEEVTIAASVTEIWRGERASRRGTETAPSSTDPIDLPPASNFLTLFEDRALAFRWHLAAGNLGTARRLLRDIEQCFLHTDSRLIQIRLAVMRAELAYHTDEVERAARLFASSRDELQAIGVPPELWQVLREEGWCAARLGAPRPSCTSSMRRPRFSSKISSTHCGSSTALSFCSTNGRLKRSTWRARSTRSFASCGGVPMVLRGCVRSDSGA
jgi:hypothetical protein